MENYTYKYIGNETVHIPYVGSFEPDPTGEGKIYTVSAVINHPDFIEVKEHIKKKEHE
ncbi:MAG: hypothetical protein M3Q44_04030 [bacterium]|nr:hypothetical protein [bacterium]